MTSEILLYKLFGLLPTCSDGELRQAYYRVMLVNLDTAKTQQLIAAYTEIKRHRISQISENVSYDIRTSFSGIDLESIAKRRNTVRNKWEKFQENPSSLITALQLIHAVFRVEQQDAIKNVLTNSILIDSAPLLLSLENKEDASETLIKWMRFLYANLKAKEGLQILEDAIATKLELPSIKPELYNLHYSWAKYEDPTTGRKSEPSVRVEHLRRLIELGGNHDYIYKSVAEAYHELGDNEQARIYLNQAYKLNPQLSGAVKISRALGFSQSSEPQPRPRKSTNTTIAAKYKHSQPEQIPSYAQINEWRQKGNWDAILEYANPYDYFPKILPKAREPLRQIADSLGSHEDSKSIDALIVLLNFGVYWDVSFAAMTSLSKVGDEKVLAVLEKFEARTIGGRAILDESISYLNKRIGYQISSVNTISPQELLDQSKKAFFKDENYQQARILLESLLPRIERSDPKYLDVVVLLARSCSKTRDYSSALELIKSIFLTLPKKYQMPLAQEMTSWFWSELGFREYTPAIDNDYCFALQANIESVLTEDDAGEALYKLKSMTRHLEQLGARSSIDLIRTLIRTEAPGSRYVDPDRENYIRKTDLSPVMKEFFAKFDEIIKTSVTEKIQKMLEGVELSNDFVMATITIKIDDDDNDEADDDKLLPEDD